MRGHFISNHFVPSKANSYQVNSSFSSSIHHTEYLFSHPSHVNNSAPFSQFLRLLRLCSDDSDFSEKSEARCQFFDKRGYPVSVAQAGHHHAQQIDRQSAL